MYFNGLFFVKIIYAKYLGQDLVLKSSIKCSYYFYNVCHNCFLICKWKLEYMLSNISFKPNIVYF